MVYPLLRARRGSSSRVRKLAWYDAQALAAGSVTYWPDSSGNGYDTSSQATSTKRPTATAAQLNGYQTVLFDGGDTLALPSGLYTLTQQNFTVIALAKRSLENATIQRIIGAAAGVTARIQFGFTATSGQINFACNSGGTAAALPGNTNTNYQIIIGRKSSTQQYLQQGLTNSTSDTNGTDVSGTDTMYLGSNRDSDRYLTGGIGELRLYDYALSASDILAEISDISARWGGLV